MSGGDLERILKIINSVRKHECLWNVNCNDYAKRDKLEKAWKDIAHEVDNTEIFCREKWRNVRTGFLRSIQQRTADDTKRKRFYLHDQMAFLLPSAEALNETRKKRKLSKECGSRKETDDEHLNNDIEGDNSILTTYNMVGKFEANDEETEKESSINDDEEIEHHTLLINGDVYTVNDNTDNDIQKILKEIEQSRIKSKTLKRKKSTTEQQQQDFSLAQNNNKEDNIVVKTIPIKDKEIRFINEQINDNSLTESNNMLNSTVKNLGETTKCIQNQKSDREEQLLLYFFRGCADDILSLNKQKQRLFKKRLLELIEELHDS